MEERPIVGCRTMGFDANVIGEACDHCWMKHGKVCGVDNKEHAHLHEFGHFWDSEPKRPNDCWWCARSH